MSNSIKAYILIEENKVSLITDVDYAAIKLDYDGHLAIVNKLPVDYMIKKNNNRILIFNISSEIKAVELFEYRGHCKIHEGTMFDRNNGKYPLHIIKEGIQLWPRLGPSQLNVYLGKSSLDEDGTKTNTSSWPDL